MQQEIDKATTESTAKQADLAVIQLAKQGSYDSAKAIADRAVAAKMEARQNQITVLDQVYQTNKDLFSTAEQQQFQAAQTERQNQLALDTHKEEAKYDEMIKQSDPLYQAQIADTYSTIAARNAAGSTNEIQTAVDKQNALQNAADAQTIGSYYQQIQGILNGAGIRKPISALTSQDLNGLSTAQQISIGQFLARMQKPDVARSGTDAGNALEPVSLLEKAGDFFRQNIAGQRYSSDKVLQALQAANSLYQQRVTPASTATAAPAYAAPGTTTVVNGHTYKSDGSQWVLIQ